ncbi:unnamed protein product [Thelazia callipaeda]|uniref:Beta-Casp domain-containing protein n=1 Tax=Thelazia callipaeda TaxID=103827 RepID=A0A0N5CLH2_THECL|nr:unnamed protein product [Thelazia callipaeda]
MQLISLSNQPYRPCLLLKWASASIMLDCAVDFDALSSFLPASICKSKLFSNLPHYPKNTSKHCLRRCGEHVLVDAPFEVHPAQICSTTMSSVDAILVSNWMSLLALPFFTEETNFNGIVYATDPTLQLGRLVMEELLDFFDRVDREKQNDFWKNPSLFMNFSNTPGSDPREWRPFYSREQMENSLTKVQRISFRESINIHGAAVVAAYSSGYSIGSCNWIIRTEHEKIGYLSATSSRNSHTKPVQWDQLRNCDALILTSICRFPEHNPETSVCHAFAVIADTLKRNGSVLMPICPTGVLYDLLEVISVQLDQHDVSVDVPVYFISSVAESTLAYSNIYAEWLSEKKQNMINVPEEPFKHGLMSRSGRLKVYDNIYGDFCQLMKTPCVIFTGHPSLRIGDAVHFLEMWGNDSRNALIMTDPDYPIQNVYGPYETLPIRAFFFPIETRLDFSQLNPSILPDLAPKLLVMSELYAHPPLNSSQRTDFVVSYKSRATYKYGDTFTIPSTLKTKRVRLHPDILRSIELRGDQDRNEFGLSSLKGVLSAYDNVLELNPDIEARGRSVMNINIGKLDPDKFARSLLKRNFDYKRDVVDGNIRFTFHNLAAVVSIQKNGYRTVISSPNPESRRQLAEVIASCLKVL